MGILLTEGRGPFGHLTAVPNLLHQVAYGQTLLNVVLSEKLSPMVNGVGFFGDDTVSQRDVGRNHQIIFPDHLNNAMVCFVGARRNRQRCDGC